MENRLAERGGYLIVGIKTASEAVKLSAFSAISAMFVFVESYWRELCEAPAGERFQRLHWRRRAARKSIAIRLVYLISGFVIMIIGLIMMPAPGPGTIVFFAGGALAAQESLWVARAMDWLEIRLRKAIAAASQLWHRSKRPSHAQANQTPRRSASKP
jgi:uncharacterized protein (TIGR02611 family)